MTQQWVVNGWAGKHSPLPDYDSVTDEGVFPLRGIPRGRAKTRLDVKVKYSKNNCENEIV